jgi:hypothetical protein
LHQKLQWSMLFHGACLLSLAGSLDFPRKSGGTVMLP